MLIKTYIIGPSHLHSSYTDIIQSEIDTQNIFNHCILDGYPGIPNWSHHILKQLISHADKNLVWVISDYKFDNSFFNDIIELKVQNKIWLDSVGSPNNVNVDYMSREHIRVLGDHSLSAIDYIVKKFPNIKLIFWCLYVRTKINNSSYPEDLQYDFIKQRYKHNIICIDNFTTPDKFRHFIRDSGGHPNKHGYQLLDDMIKSITL